MIGYETLTKIAHGEQDAYHSESHEMAQEVLEYRRVHAKMLEWASELEKAGGVGRFIAEEVRRRLRS